MTSLFASVNQHNFTLEEKENTQLLSTLSLTSAMAAELFIFNPWNLKWRKERSRASYVSSRITLNAYISDIGFSHCV